MHTSQAPCQETGYPIVDIADDALIKFDSASDSDDDPLPYAPYADWEMVPSPLGSIHAYYDIEGHTKHFTSLCELLHMVHVLETMDGRVIYMFVDVSYPLSAATLKRMLKNGLEVPKLLVGRDLTMAEQLVSFIKASLLNAQSTVCSMVFHVGVSPHNKWFSVHHG
nr:aminoacyl-tRNA synthetase, class 1a, anticodon-binding [Tanacetum cinerariifolium]